MNELKPAEYYQQRVATLSTERKKIATRKNAIAWSRLAAIVGAVLLFVLLKNINLIAAVVAAIICCAIFLRLVVVAINVAAQLNHIDHLIAINQQELETAAGRYYHLPDGKEHLPALHSYAYDLDIFGRASLFQFISRTTTQQGSSTLAHWLLQPATENEILQRQEAAKELAGLPEWSQHFEAHGKTRTITIATQQKIEQWLADKDDYFAKPIWKIIRWIGPVISLTVLGLYIADVIEYKVFFLCVFVIFLITGFITRKATPAYHTLGKIAPEIAALSALAKHIEEQSFQSGWLQQRQQFFTKENANASVVIKSLNGILSRLDYRLNPVAFIPLNIFLYWDLQQMLSFEKWKKNNAANVQEWFTAVGEMEAINSLAILHFNHPHWAFPQIKKEHGYFEVNELGHPLIAAAKVVRSSFGTSGEGKVAIITGSNMAGKSTFLRSVGLSLVMGQAGAPVNAKQAAFSPMKVMSTMRISDNLEESTSTFYAELKKLKDIIDAVNRHEKVYLLLDEILRGTNSLDRHTGSKALIKQLIQHQASGIIATHDLALAELIKEYPQSIANYHFDVQVAGEELYFDYKLKEGICQSLNASVLMKKIGIEM
jgi:ABC-type polar amino acid transport system ATPase subunit